MCLLGPIFSTGPMVGLEEDHLGVSLLDRKVGSCGLRPGDDTKLMRIWVCQGWRYRRVFLHLDGLLEWADLGGPQLPTQLPSEVSIYSGTWTYFSGVCFSHIFSLLSHSSEKHLLTFLTQDRVYQHH